MKGIWINNLEITTRAKKYTERWCMRKKYILEDIITILEEIGIVNVIKIDTTANKPRKLKVTCENGKKHIIGIDVIEQGADCKVIWKLYQGYSVVIYYEVQEKGKSINGIGRFRKVGKNSQVKNIVTSHSKAGYNIKLTENNTIIEINIEQESIYDSNKVILSEKELIQLAIKYRRYSAKTILDIVLSTLEIRDISQIPKMSATWNEIGEDVLYSKEITKIVVQRGIVTEYSEYNTNTDEWYKVYSNGKWEYKNNELYIGIYQDIDIVEYYLKPDIKRTKYNIEQSIRYAKSKAMWTFDKVAKMKY